MNKLAQSNLPPKQIQNFKDLIKLYESKQFKKGLKLADKMLEVIPDNAETLCMKGLLLNLTDKKEEGLDLAKKALMKNLKSEICWHVLGIIHRNNKSYAEAIKCYNMALKFDSTNLQILRDLALLQMQIRDYKNHFKTRQILLQDKPQQPINWAGFALANHFLKDYNQTQEVLNSLWKIIINDKDVKAQEKNELVCYEASMNLEWKNYENLQTILQEKKHLFLDQLYYHECQLEYFYFKKDKEKQLETIKTLIELNPNDNKYYIKEIDVRGLSNKEIVEYYKNKLVLDKSNIFMEIEILKHLEEEKEFKDYLREMIKPYYRKGIPSVFKKFKGFYQEQSGKVKWIGETLENISSYLQKDGNFDGQGQESPTCVLWSIMVLSQHYDRVYQYSKALELIEDAINHTPTLIELYLLKSKYQKHSGYLIESLQTTQLAQSLDTADRYLNNKLIKHSLRLNHIDSAHQLYKDFMKEDSNPHELQTMWYELQTALSYLRINQLEKSLRWFNFIKEHFEEIYEDQFDFYTFSLKKYHLRYYYNLVKHEDNLYSNYKYLYALQHVLLAFTKYHQYQLFSNTHQTQEKKKLIGNEKKKAKKLEDNQIKDNNLNQNDHIYKYDLNGERYIAAIQDVFLEAQKWINYLLKVDSTHSLLYLKALQSVWNFYIYKKETFENLNFVFNKINQIQVFDVESELIKIQYTNIFSKSQDSEIQQNIAKIKENNPKQQLEQYSNKYEFGAEYMHQFLLIRINYAENQLQNEEYLNQLNQLLKEDIQLQLALKVYEFVINLDIVLENSENLIKEETRMNLEKRFPKVTIFREQQENKEKD